jgi:hypothetical protein
VLHLLARSPLGRLKLPLGLLERRHLPARDDARLGRQNVR